MISIIQSLYNRKPHFLLPLITTSHLFQPPAVMLVLYHTPICHRTAVCTWNVLNSIPLINIKSHGRVLMGFKVPLVHSTKTPSWTLFYFNLSHMTHHDVLIACNVFDFFFLHFEHYLKVNILGPLLNICRKC